jgi:hypothetical protein
MTEIENLRTDCAIAGKLWSRTFSGLLMATLRSYGSDVLDRLWAALLRSHQDRYYVASLQKLGIAGDTPARAAAKYHYFSNALGGLTMQYIEETPKKVWIRYLAPSWTYPGTALHALPKGIRRTVFSTWHPRNGELMGCLRLGWVCTKLIDEGDPYDEGYFIEHERDLDPSERATFERPNTTPEFLPGTAPVLDPAAWPEVRLLRANRNYAGEYVRDTVDQLYQLLGEAGAHDVVAHTMRVLAAQYVHELAGDVKIDASSAEGLAGLHGELHRACGGGYQLERISVAAWRLTLDGTRPFPAPREELRRALFEFQINSGRVLNGHLRLTREPTETGERWTFEDTGRWLW